MEIDMEVTAPPAKRWCPLISDEEPSHGNPASLVALDIDCFGHLLHFLDSFEAMSLIQTGNWNIMTKTKLKLAHFEYQVDYQNEQFYSVSTTKRLQWPALLTQPLPSLHTIIIDAVNVEFKFTAFTSLPPMLRRLSLKFCTIKDDFGKSNELLQFNCPSLTRLSISSVTVINTITPKTPFMAPSDWIPRLLKQCNQLLRLSLPNLRHVEISSAQIVMDSLPPTLERLSTSMFLLSLVTNWPSNLHSLVAIGRTHINTPVFTKCLPSSITYVSIYYMHEQAIVLPFLEKLPPSLSHLAIHLEGNAQFGQWLIDAMPRFSQLSVLKVEDPLFNKRTVNQAAITDLSILPRSITQLSDVFTFYPSQWRHLPVNAQFVSLEREYQWCGRGICVDGQALVAPHMNHIPLGTDRLWLASAIPTGYHFPHVNNLSYDIDYGELTIPANLFSIIDCNMLSRLDIYVTSGATFDWFPSSIVLPSLQTLLLTYESSPTYPSVKVIHVLIRSLPKSLRHLSIFAQREEDVPLNNRGVLVLCDSDLPSSLQSCNLKLPNFSVTLPAVMPHFLANLEVRCYGFVPDFSNSYLACFPNTLHDLCVKAYGAPHTLSISAKGAKAFCAANRHHPMRQITIKD